MRLSDLLEIRGAFFGNSRVGQSLILASNGMLLLVDTGHSHFHEDKMGWEPNKFYGMGELRRIQVGENQSESLGSDTSVKLG